MEVWKDVKGFEGYYQVSNTGKVRSLERTQKDKNGRTVHYQGKVLKGKPNSRGYLRVELKNAVKNERWFVHRLVATHFIENASPECNNVVNHIDSNFLNNNADNLEWTTHYGNAHHAIDKGRMKRTEKWKQNLRKGWSKHFTPVVGTNMQTGEEIYFERLNDCAKQGFQPACVCECCKGKQKYHKGYVWKYVWQMRNL